MRCIALEFQPNNNEVTINEGKGLWDMTKGIGNFLSFRFAVRMVKSGIKWRWMNVSQALQDFYISELCHI